MNGFEFDFRPGTLVGGPGSVDDIGAKLESKGVQRALVVCGSSVGATPAVMEPVREGLGDALVGVFDGTSAAKRLGAALDAASVARERGADALVAVGGGSALDTAKVAAALASHADPRAVAERAVESGSVPVSDGALPVAAVPTTLAGADLSVTAGVTLALDREDSHAEGSPPSGSVSDSRLMPTLLCYDAELFAATPRDLLCASAMNGFDKAVEALYSPYATPVTDATATEGVRRFAEHAAVLPERDPDRERLQEAVNAVVLAQYGVSTPGRYRLSVVHAFGHGFSHGYDVHQGTVHGVLAPHVLRFVFEEVDGRREALARAFGAETGGMADGDLADAAVAGVEGVRDDLGLLRRLRDVDGVKRADFPAVAEVVVEDGLMDGRPDGLDVSTDAVEGVLHEAW